MIGWLVALALLVGVAVLAGAGWYVYVIGALVLLFVGALIWVGSIDFWPG